MKTRLSTSILLIVSALFFLTVPQNVWSVVPAAMTTSEVNPTTDCVLALFAPLSLNDLKNRSRKEVEEQLDRRLTMSERMTLRLLKRQAKRMDSLEISQEDCTMLEKKASNGILFGILGLIIAGIIFGILAISMGSKAVKLAKADPDCPNAEKNRKKGNAAIVLGVLDIIGAIVILAIIL